MPSAFPGWVAATVCAAAVVVSAQSASREPTRDTVLAVQDSGWIDVLDAFTLETLGRIAARPMAQRATASPDGRTLFVNQIASVPDGGCCALYAFELATRRTCPMLYPADEGVPSPDGRGLFAQRGNVGIDVFDMPTLARLPALHAEGRASPYRLYPSPDGRWLFAHAIWGDKWVDVFDLRRGSFVRRIPVRGSAGAWLGDAYFVLGKQEGARVLTRLTPETGELTGPLAIGDTAAWAADPSGGDLAGGGGRLFAWTRSAPWLIRSGPLDVAFRGVRVIDPERLRVERHLAPGVEIGDVALSADGATLFVIASAPEPNEPSMLVRVDVATGRPIAQRPLPIGIRSISTVAMPRSLVPSGDLVLTPCSR